VALCGALPAGAAGICARGCDGGCPEGQACEADVCVPVEAQAATRRRITQAIAPGRHAVDFLFVVDNSGSMCQEQAALTRTLEAVVPTLSRLDYRIAVISTDMRTEGQQGRFLASPAPPEASLNCGDAQGESVRARHRRLRHLPRWTRPARDHQRPRDPRSGGPQGLVSLPRHPRHQR
jgi:hypothetical protein